MNKLKDAANEFLTAGKNLTKEVLNAGKEQYEKHVEPTITEVKDSVKQAKVKQEIKAKKVVDIKQDKSRRKYHRGG